jgi:hypothetical protein
MSRQNGLQNELPVVQSDASRPKMKSSKRMKVSSIGSEGGGDNLVGLWWNINSIRFRSLSPWRPTEWPATEKVYVQMVYRLTTMIAAIHDETISLFEMK